MSVAVTIALHQGARWIGETLASLQAQSEPPAEIAVVDDASTDAGPEVVRAAGHTVLCNPGRGGIASRNHGLRSTRAAYVAFVDQDDVWSPSHFARLRELLDRHPDSPAAFSRVRHFDDGSAVELDVGSEQATTFDPWARFPLSLGGLQTTSAVLVRRAAVEAVGGWPAGFPGVADQVLWYALAVRGPFVRLDARTTGHRMHPDSFLQRLRREDRLLESQLTAWRHALRQRAATLPRDPARGLLERRLALAESACDAARAQRAGALDACRAALARHAALAAGEQPRALQKFWRRVVWMATPDGDADAHARLVAGLRECWPPDGASGSVL